jgi:hypothetical protein
LEGEALNTVAVTSFNGLEPWTFCLNVLDFLFFHRFCGYVHDEDVEEGGERSKKDFLMLFFSETGLHLLREATDLFVGRNALLLHVRNLSPPPPHPHPCFCCDIVLKFFVFSLSL